MDSIQRINNETINAAEEVCRPVCLPNQQYTISGACVMNKTLTGRIQQLLDSLKQQSVSNQSGFLGFVVDSQANVADVEQTITNQLTQFVANTCQGSSERLLKGDISYRRTTDGDVVFEEPVSACVMNNMAKVIAYNEMLAKTERNQINTTTFTIILVVIVAMITIGALVLFLFFNQQNTVMWRPITSTRFI